MNIYLIANNSSLDNKWCLNMNSKIVPNKNDLIIRFNHGALLSLFNGRTTHVLFRSDNVGFQGLSNYRIKNKLFLRNKDSINFGLIYYPHENIKRQQELIHIQKINNIKINTIIPITNDIKKLTGKSPSSGFATIIYLLKTYPKSNIYLMGFNFYNGANNWHNFNKEIQVINNLQKLNNNIKLFL